MYPKANWPQAWSASAPLTVMQALLGIFPYAPLNVLLVDPLKVTRTDEPDVGLNSNSVNLS
jgi:glycogen debranching enzyme